MKIAVITAGGAGMFCGSCMQDNTLVRALRMAGQDAVLVPTYTPIRVDEEDVSTDRVFLGGINVYLDSVMPGWKFLPGWMTNWLNRESVISALSRIGAGNDASKLGSLTLDMLKGTNGPQRREVHEFTDYLCSELNPDVIIFSNALLSGVLSELRPRFPGKILCLLQGDDIFLEALSKRWKPPVLKQLIQNCKSFDGFLTHSDYYRHFMAEYLQLPGSVFRRIPLTVDEHCVEESDAHDESQPFHIGYFARVCPEKGIQNLLRAAAQVLPRFPNVRLTVAGYLPQQHQNWFHQLLSDARTVVGDRIHWAGSPEDRQEKFGIIRSFDLLCIPTDYREPKGLYVLEAALHGVPSLVPDHGAFPELIETLGHGALYNPADESGLMEALCRLISEGRSSVQGLADCVSQTYGIETTGPKLVQTIESFLR